MAERDPKIAGARIAKRRHQLDMTQVELAAALGVSPSSLANWERGASYPKRKLGKIEQVLGISLTNGDDEPRRAPSRSVDEALDRAQQEIERLRAVIHDQDDQGKSDEHSKGSRARRAG